MKEKITRSTKFLAGHILFSLTIAVHTTVLLLSTRVSFFPGTDVLRTIVTTCAQIIAGLYGITAAGYTFFLSRIDGLCTQDTTLYYIVASLKKRYQYLMWFLTGNVLVTLMVSILLLYLPVPMESDHAFYYRFFCNEFIVSLGSSMIFILYYSLSVVNPRAIEKEARKLKKRISHSLLPSGDIVRFIALYDGIDRRCRALIDPAALARIRETKGQRFEYVIELLLLTRVLPSSLLLEIQTVHRYYACTLNSSPMTVTHEMVELAQRVCDKLDQQTKS